jgi:hypothetical protein
LTPRTKKGSLVVLWRQPVEVIGVAMGDDDRVDLERVIRVRLTVEVHRRGVACEQLSVAAIDEDGLSFRSSDVRF